jgi:hypothetical protein
MFFLLKLLEPATKEDVKEALNLMENHEKALMSFPPPETFNGQVAVVAFVKQIVDVANKSSELLVEPPSPDMPKKLKLLKKGEFADFTLLVPVICENGVVLLFEIESDECRADEGTLDSFF